MNRRKLLAGLSLSALSMTAAPLFSRRAWAADYPASIVSIVNGYAPGGSTDIAARILAENAASRLGPSAKMIVENRKGASGTVASEWLTRQANDGHTLMVSESSSYAIWPAIGPKMAYDSTKDFTWIAGICTSPMVFIVSPQFPAKTLDEALKVLASDQSEALPYSSSGAGAITHIGPELLRHTLGAGAQSIHVPYAGGAPAALSVAQNETSWGMASLGTASNLISGGLVRPLAVTGAARFPSHPEIPTFTETGLPEMEIVIYYLLHGPAGMPEDVVAKLSQATAGAVAEQRVKDALLVAGMEGWTGPNDPAATSAIVERELARFREIGEKTGITITG